MPYDESPSEPLVPNDEVESSTPAPPPSPEPAGVTPSENRDALPSPDPAPSARMSDPTPVVSESPIADAGVATPSEASATRPATKRSSASRAAPRKRKRRPSIPVRHNVTPGAAPGIEASQLTQADIPQPAESVASSTEQAEQPVADSAPAPAFVPAHDTAEMVRQAQIAGKSAAISCIDFSEDHVHVQNITDIEDFVLHLRPEWSKVRWINVNGLTDIEVIKAIAEKYQLHPLAIEDLLHVPQRPKVDSYGGAGEQPLRWFIIARMVELVDGKLHSEQISFFLGKRTLLTFQETPGDVWNPIRERICKSGSQIRRNGAAFLCYSLLDALVDHCFPILEQYGERLDAIEEMIVTRPQDVSLLDIHVLRRELMLLRRDLWPMREVVHFLQRESGGLIDDTTRTYLRDVYDHLVQIMDLIEIYRDVANSLAETHMSAVSLKMNETIKVLTVLATIFTPITFLASVYGMNFTNQPELHWEYSYAVFWLVCISMAVGMFVWFKRRGWM